MSKFNKSMREKEKKWERPREKILNFDNHITEIPVAQTCWLSVCEVLEVWSAQREINCCNAIAEIGGKKICGNAIAENGRKKKIMVFEIWRGIKKKKCYVHNICTIFSQQITGD